ncbi:MAG: sterol desaturase family protein [Leptolyngbyaceae cyanobacterium bins.302]|nr:sterol desaturase family protein [Leptolyngbyaceae cyanobacterium bins.302]
MLQPLMGTVVPIVTLFFLFEVSTRISQQVAVAVSSTPLWLDMQGLFALIAVIAVLNLPLIIAEWVWPGTNARRRYFEAAKFWVLYLSVGFFWSKVTILITTALKIKPLFTWQTQGNANPLLYTLSVVFGIALSVLIYDFFYYWFHRAQHQFPWLWRFHQVHHSIRELNCLNSYHHVAEDILRFPMVMLPVAFLMKIDSPQLVLVSAFVGVWGQYIHSDTRINFGRMRLIVADNFYHRIHHSVFERHFDKNFASYVPLWDILFGTYYKPENGGLVPVGLAELPPPKTIADYLFMPFRR